MDARQLAFLARQPSAALKKREHFWGLPKRGIALILANAMFWQPMWAQADGIVVSGSGTGLAQAGNGVPIVNIATPNATGLSHNQFQQYNVDAQGLILNNIAQQTGATQLGGIIVGNPNMNNGVAAQVILNEVVGANASQLKGYTEVAGQAARVIVANPYGITCNGCGFLNTPQVTLTTGKPVLDSNGGLVRFNVQNGSVAIEGLGLNADNVDQFDIITRSAKINAELHAKKLNIIAGRNDVDAQTLSATALADDGSAKPELAIDSSALGGMYVGAVKLVGTEAGVGVRLASNVAASAGDIQIDANGKLTLTQAVASGAMAVNATAVEVKGPLYAGTSLSVTTPGDLTIQQNVAARDVVTLSSGGQLTNTAIIEAGVNADNSRNETGDINLNAHTLNNSGKSVIASRNLAVKASGVLNNQGGTLSAQGQADISAATLDNQSNGRVLSRGTLTVVADQVLNSQGLITSSGNLDATLGYLNNRNGELNGLGNTTLRVVSLDNVAGLVAAGQLLDINARGQLNNQSGRLAAAQGIDLQAAVLDNSQQGSINSQGTLGIKSSGKLSNHQQGRIEAKGTTHVNAGSFDNHQGGTLSSTQTLNLTAGQVDNSQSGKIASAMALTASVTGLDQHEGGQLYSNTDLSLDLNQGELNNRNALINASGQLLLKNLKDVINQHGEISNTESFELIAESLDNRSGKVISKDTLLIRIANELNNAKGLLSAQGLQMQTGSLDNRGGLIGANTVLDLRAESLDNRESGAIVSDGRLTAQVTGLLDNQGAGEVAAKETLDISSGSLDNRGGNLNSKGVLTLRSDSGDNRGGVVQADGSLKLTVGELDNRDKGIITGKAEVAVEGSTLQNQSGLLSGVGPVRLAVTDVQNDTGRISSQGELTAIVGTLQQQGGALVAQGDLSLTGSRLDNRNNGLVGSSKALKLEVEQIDNRGGELSSGLAINVTSQGLDNSDGGKVIAGTALELQVGQLISQNKGLISAKGATTLSGTTLDSSGGTIASLGNLSISLEGALLNQQGLISSEGSLSISANGLDNSAGSLSSAGALSINSGGSLLNLGGSVSTDDSLTLESASFDNSQKGLVSSLGASHVKTGAFDNSEGGRLISSSTLDLAATQVKNIKGRIASDKALNASVSDLDQQGGELFSNASLSLDMNHGQLNNLGGWINTPGVLLLKNLNGVNNQKGEISSAEAFTLAAENLDNSNGQISSNGSLDVHIDNVFDNQRGSLMTDGALLLTASRLDNRAGEIVGKTDLNATLTALDNQQGKLISTAAMTLTADSVDNRQGGLIGAAKVLGIDVDEFDNRGGEVTGNKDVTLVSQALDNSDSGQIFAGQALKLAVDQLFNRTQGQIIARTRLELEGRTLDNSGGLLKSQELQRISLSGNLENAAGQISSEGSLNVTAATLTSLKGSLSSASDLTVTTQGLLDNRGGELLTDGSLIIDSASLDNRQAGNLSGKGLVKVTTGTFDNSQGVLNSGSTLDLKATQVTNKDGGLIGSQGALLASATGLDQQGGKLFSRSSLSLDMNNGHLNNQGGLISAPGTLLLKRLSDVNNQGGEISSAEAFTISAQNLDVSNGKLLSDQSLTLRIAQALSNVKGLIGAASLDLHSGSLKNDGGTLTSRGDLDLLVDRQLDNQAQGLISAVHNLDTRSAALNNQGGSLLAGNRLVLSATELDNRSNGLINSQGDLSLNVTSLDSSQGGEVSAKGDLGLTLSSLVQKGGRLLGDKAVTLNLSGSDLDNQNGLINAKGLLTLNGLRDLNNKGGEISSSQSLNLMVRNLDNSGGKLITSQLLTVTGATLGNQNGLVSGWQGLSVSGSSLDNSKNGTLSSSQGNVSLELDGSLLNRSGGALVSQGRLDVKADSIDNSDKGILSSGAGQILTVNGLVDNGQGGLIDSGEGLEIKAASLSNAAGTINAQQALTLDAATLLNAGGSLVGNDAVKLNVGSLDNRSGRLASVGTLTILDVDHINNQHGTLASQSLMTLTGGTLDNSDGGTVAANEMLDISVRDALRNDNNGLIYSQNAGIKVQAASLANSLGALQSQNGLSLEVRGDISSQGGKIIAQTGDVSVQAANLDNRGGVLASLKGMLEARISGALSNGYDTGNKGGVIQGLGLNLQALAGLNNNGGRIAAQSRDLIINTTDVNNQNGGLYAGGLVRINGNHLDSSSGQIAGNRIELGLNGVLTNRAGIVESDTTLAVTATSVDNQNGKLRALGTTGATAFQIGGLFDNRNGSLETANSDLNLNAGSFQNAGGQLLHMGEGTFDISLPNVTGAGGTIVTRGGLTLNADTWTNTSVIQAGRLNVNVNNFTQTATGQLLASSRLEGSGGSWINNGLIASDGSLSLLLSGAYGGSGRLTSLGDMNANVASVNLDSSASIAGGATTTLSVQGQVINNGRLSSAGALAINASGITNQGTLGSGQSLSIVASNLSNLTANALLFSGAKMDLQVANLTNSYANLYSMGGLDISGGAGRRAASVENSSGSIVALGSVNVKADTFANKSESFAAGGTLTSSYIATRCLPPCRGFWGLEYIVRDEYKGVAATSTPAASLSAGGDFTFEGTTFNNQESSLTAAGNINITSTNFTNVGSASGDVVRVRTYLTSMSSGDATSLNDRYIDPYNAKNNSYLFPYDFSSNVWYRAQNGEIRLGDMHYDPDPAMRDSVIYDSKTQEPVFDGVNWLFLSVRSGKKYDGSNFVPLPDFLNASILNSDEITGGTLRSAIVQAGGNVTITGTQDINNAVVRQLTPVSPTGKPLGEVAVDKHARTIFINSQLPPDLLQQQVNPLSLPGFSLPDGQTGLFRLSSESANGVQTNPVGNQPADWVIGQASISSGQRQQVGAVPGPQSFSGLTAPVVTSRDLDAVSRDSSASNIGARALDVSTAVVSGGGGRGTEEANGGISSVAAITTGAGQTLQSALDQTLTRVAGVPDASGSRNPHKYLIETNPVLTDLRQFMSSDYLLSNLGYDPDESVRRLGDGLYEQRLIQQAVVARTGQRFIDGQTSDEALFKYLMDNAIASKDRLNLSLGVTLTAQQVAALTHDIVWLEEHEVAGEKVLVPVLYLAQANNRLAPTGALIAGNDINLIAGKDLKNAGTLLASNNLSATAGNDIANSGLIQAGNRLDLLAGNSIVNNGGGVLAARDINLVAVEGDVINERSVHTYDMRSGSYTQSKSFADEAARIEADNAISIIAGRDFANVGGVISSGDDVKIVAGRDASNVSAEERDKEAGPAYLDETVVQHQAQINSGRDVSIRAGRDVASIAAQITAARDIGFVAEGNITVGAAANEEHYFSKTKEQTFQEDHVAQQGSSVTAGGNVAMSAGKDMSLISSRISAGDEAYLVAAGKIDVLARQNSDYSLYDEKFKGNFGTGSTQRDEITKVTHVGSEITTGGNLTLISAGDQRYQVARLDSGENLTLTSGGSITFEGVKDLKQESHEKSDNSMSWNSAKGEGTTDETLRQSQLIAKGNTVIQAVDGLKIDLKQIDQKSISETIDVMVQADPQLAWLKDAEKRGDVDWRLVKEVHESFQYSSSGMGAGAMLAVIIIVTVLTAGAASTAVASASTAMGASATGTMAAAVGTTAAGLGNMAATAVVTSVASTAAVSTINNKGNLGAAFKEVISSESLKGYVLAGVSAGIAAQFGFNPTELKFDLPSAEQLAIKVAADSLAKTAIMGGSLKDNLSGAIVGAAVSIGGAVGANKIGNATIGSSEWTKVALHATFGGLMAEAMGGDFRTGALAAGANEVMVNLLADSVLPEGNKLDPVAYQDATARLMAYSQLVGILASTITGGDAGVGAAVAANATEYNYLKHVEMAQLNKELAGCEGRGDCDAVGAKFFEKHIANKETLEKVCQVSKQGCMDAAVEIYEAVYGFQAGEYPEELDKRGREILATFHTFNLDARTDATGGIIAPTAESFMASLGLDPNDPNVRAAARGIASIIAGKVSGKGAKGSAIPTPLSTVASNGLAYKSNPKHTPGQPGNRANAGIEPGNSLELFGQSIPSSKTYGNKEVRFSVDQNGAVHRFEGTNGEYHWNGSSGDANNPLTGVQVPNDVQKKLGVKLK
ncbi:filamentous hemagglutinin N-terminal domain-containing protein [Pseudomonas lijiangensis]|uniref:two-partner secretion domain-containing protein n=1 Tax=Pseudomonas lijiangensis TaxID=2995658 RepID=UPI0031BA68CD